MRSTPGKVMETAGLVWARAVASQELLFLELKPLSLAVYSNDDHESIRTSEVEDLHHRCLMPLGRAEPPQAFCRRVPSIATYMATEER